MKLTVTIELDNDALAGRSGNAEVARLLRDAANRYPKLRGVDDSIRLLDINGNTVGMMEITEGSIS